MSDVVLDTTVFNEIKELMGDAMGTLVEKYHSQSATYVSEIREGIAAGDAERVARAAHPLKSSSKQLGAMQISELARIIELEAKSAHAVTDTIRNAHSTLDSSFKSTCDALNAALAA